MSLTLDNCLNDFNAIYPFSAYVKVPPVIGFHLVVTFTQHAPKLGSSVAFTLMENYSQEYSVIRNKLLHIFVHKKWDLRVTMIIFS